MSFYYLREFKLGRPRWSFRDWALDSGAYSAKHIGAVIDFREYLNECKRLQVTDPQLKEIFSLDVIGDWRASARNTEAMWKEGVKAIPCYHGGEPWSVLTGLARDYPKIALGGVSGVRGKRKLDWARECFRRVWPKKIHGFGFCSRTILMALPFHSVDATSWEMGPCKFGRWQSHGGNQLSVRGGSQNLRSEVAWYLRLEAEVRARWAKDMRKLDAK